MWYEWFTERQWEEPLPRQHMHGLRVTIGFMRPFLPNGYDTYSGDLLAIAEEAERETLNFLPVTGSRAAAVGTCVPALKKAEPRGADERLRRPT